MNARFTLSFYPDPCISMYSLLSLGVYVVVAVVGEGMEGGGEQVHHGGLHTAALWSVAQGHHAEGVARLLQSQLSTQ